MIYKSLYIHNDMCVCTCMRERWGPLKYTTIPINKCKKKMRETQNNH